MSDIVGSVIFHSRVSLDIIVLLSYLDLHLMTADVYSEIRVHRKIDSKEEESRSYPMLADHT